MVVKDSKASKLKNKEEHAAEDSSSITPEELATIFSTANFPFPDESMYDLGKDEEKVELDISNYLCLLISIKKRVSFIISYLLIFYLYR